MFLQPHFWLGLSFWFGNLGFAFGTFGFVFALVGQQDYREKYRQKKVLQIIRNNLRLLSCILLISILCSQNGDKLAPFPRGQGQPMQ